MLKHMDTEDDVVDGIDTCPRCQCPLMEKKPSDKRQLQKVVRFFCMCGFYKDISIKELQSEGRNVC